MMLTKLLLILLGMSIILPSRIEGPYVDLEKEPCPHHDDVYGPKPQNFTEKPPSEEIKPTVIDTHHQLGKLPSATQILDSILNNNDYRLRPGFGGKPTLVTVELSVNNLGPISVMNMKYSVDITFRQTWYDERLRYNDSFESFVLTGNMVSQLWIPDTFVRNSKRTEVYAITTYSHMVRIYKNGKVSYTARMAIDAGCSFHMSKFPMDSHSCPLSFSSFSYPESEMMYKWEDFKLQIDESKTWKLLQFDFKGVTNETAIVSTVDGNFMVLTIFFNVSRHFGFDVFHNYVQPSATTVMSWISFWIKQDCTQARTSVGITSVLTMTTLSSYSRRNIPCVSCITALDLYVAICFIFCFCALMEFAVLNYLTYNYTKAHASPRLRHPPTRARAHQQEQQDVTVHEIKDSEDESDEEEGPSCPAQQSINPNLTKHHGGCCRFCKYLCVVRSCEGSVWQQGRLFIHIYYLDYYCRIIFPVTFFFFNVIYWLVCLNM